LRERVGVRGDDFFSITSALEREGESEGREADSLSLRGRG
jgi:hypothetical protein